MQHLSVSVQTIFPYSIQILHLPTVLSSKGNKSLEKVNSVVDEFQFQ
jgi:hypothetical protein